MNTLQPNRLWDEDDFSFLRTETACILLPAETTLSEQEITMLDRLLTAIGITHAERRYMYGIERDIKLPESCQTALLFSDNRNQVPEKTTGKHEGQKIFRLPAIDAILDDKELKRQIWNLIK